MRVRVGSSCLVGVLCVIVTHVASAQISTDNARCRAAIAKGVVNLAKVTLKEREGCFYDRMRGLLSPQTNCSDPATSPASVRIPKAALRLARLAETCTDSSVPAALGYVVCPPPCESIAVSDYTGVASCLSCLTEASVGVALDLTYGSPQGFLTSSDLSCQKIIGLGLLKYWVSRFKVQRKCQLDEDLSPSGTDCRTADADNQVRMAASALDEKISRCSADSLSRLDSCAADVSAEQQCVRVITEQYSDLLFEAIYRPAVPPGGTPTPTPTATLVVSQTPTATVPPTATLGPTDTPTIPPSLSVAITAYRPKSESYGNPFQRRAVPEDIEEIPGAGIRINGDDDDGNGVSDTDDTTVVSENDLIEITLQVGLLAAPPGYEYVLKRTAGSLQVWNNSDKGYALLDNNDEAVVTFGALTRTLWVECNGPVPGQLQFVARRIADASDVASDRVQFYPFTSIIIALGGESQTPSDPPDSNYGTFNIAANLYALGYDVHMYDEDNVRSDGTGAVYDEVVSAVRQRDVHSVTIFGYSHGGGSTHDLAQRLNSNRAGIGTFVIPYTAYTDGIRNSSDIDVRSEDRLPPSTLYHVNYYQRNDFFIRGDSVPGANVDVNTDASSHSAIDDLSWVRSGVQGPLVDRVPR